jgi:hypothetical protein
MASDPNITLLSIAFATGIAVKRLNHSHPEGFARRIGASASRKPGLLTRPDSLLRRFEALVRHADSLD